MINIKKLFNHYLLKKEIVIMNLQRIKNKCLLLGVLLLTLVIQPGNIHAMLHQDTHVIGHDELMATFWKYGYDLEGEWKRHVAAYMMDNGTFSAEKCTENQIIIEAGVKHIQAIIKTVKDKHLQDLIIFLAQSNQDAELNFARYQNRSMIAPQLLIPTLCDAINNQADYLVSQEELIRYIQPSENNKELSHRRPLESSEVFRINDNRINKDFVLNFIYAQLIKYFTYDTLFSGNQKNLLLQTHPELLTRIPHCFIIIEGTGTEYRLALRVDEDYQQAGTYQPSDWYKKTVATRAIHLLSVAPKKAGRSASAAVLTLLSMPFKFCWWTTQLGLTATRNVFHNTLSLISWSFENTTKLAVPVLLFLIWMLLKEQATDGHSVDYHLLASELMQQLKNATEASGQLSYDHIASLTEQIKNNTSPEIIMQNIQVLLESLPKENIAQTIEIFREFMLNASLTTGSFPVGLENSEETQSSYQDQHPVPNEDVNQTWNDFLWEHLELLRT